MKIQILIFNGFDELDAIAPFEVFQSVAAMGIDVRAELVTLDDPVEIIAAHGLRIVPNAKLERDRKLDILVVPGGGWVGRAPQGAKAEVERGTIPDEIAHLHQNGGAIALVCTGAMLVAAAGLLSGRPAITHHEAIEDLKATGAEIIKARVVDDGDITLFYHSPKPFAISNFCNYCTVSDRARYFFREIPSCDCMREF